MTTAAIIFPHQLFESPEFKDKVKKVYLVEEYLFFRQYSFHKRKIAFHRASMKYYEQYLKVNGYEVTYKDAQQETSDIRLLIPHLKKSGITTVTYIDSTDNWLEKRLQLAASESGITLHKIHSPLFINSEEEINQYFINRKRLFQTDFYTHQRKSRNILLEKDGKPAGGKWSFDDENRLKYPKGKKPPQRLFAALNKYQKEAILYTDKHFKDNYGQLNQEFSYPCTHEESARWLESFLREAFSEFGPYEDAIVEREHFLHHSVITPMLNVGLLTPQQVLDAVISYSRKNNVPLNSLEGFIRQIIGWREFIRGVYQVKGTEQRIRNYWKFTRKIPESWWKGQTGIAPIDITIRKILETGYCHHIERLMVLGNFMLLCEFDPDEVYRWFMELFIDSYDWVMVPNVYGMSQFSDGGLMSTKPYISGSNYLMKMSDYSKGDWQETWDALFWHFMDKQRQFFLQNPRLGMLVRAFDKMAEEKRNGLLTRARSYLHQLDKS